MIPQPSTINRPGPDIRVRLLQESELPAADYIMRLAFGTFIGLPDPTAFMGDANYVLTRWKADPDAAFGAEANGELVGSNFASNWGSVGFFGPLTVHPERWKQGTAKLLMEPIMECFAEWGTKHAGLFTFAQSAKHVSLYQKFGFWPRFLTAIMSKPVEQVNDKLQWSRFSEVPEGEKELTLLSCRQLTDAIYEGLDVTREIQSVVSQGLGDTVLLWENGKLSGLAVCHCGPGTEAGSNTCYIKFGAVHSGTNAERDFKSLLKACEKMAAEKGLQRVTAGVNTGRYEAYRHMLNSGFRTELQGVAMERPNEPGYNRSGIYLIDDWR
jgi:GNAT superfamily N-acetyltransferase